MRRRGPVRRVGRRTIAASCALLGLAASLAGASGLNFNWNTSKQCPAAATPYWDFACDRNETLMYMVASFKPNIALPGLNALEARIDGYSVGPIPAWWQAFNAGSCRETAFTPGVIDTLPKAPCAGTATTRLWTTQPYGGMGAWIYDASNRFHTVIGFATAANRAANLSVSTQYNAFHIAVSTSNTVYVAPDPSNGIEEVLPCAGCQEGVTLVLNQIGIYGAAGTEDQIFLPIDAVSNANGPCIHYHYDAPNVCFVPVRSTTWGQLKGMYR